MNIERLIPPALAWRLGRKKRKAREDELFRNLYSQFLKPGNLCFDIGANLGNRIRSFRDLGCKVVALEPQSSCFSALEKRFGTDKDVILLNQAAGSSEGEMEIHISPDHVLSSLSPTFIQRTTESGRFARSRWNRREKCRVTTLDSLIGDHGVPGFVKIDVEGFEAEVLAGLSHPVPGISIEWTPELPENARSCIGRLANLGDYEFNISWGETMIFSKRGWRSAEAMLGLVDELAHEPFLFGDIYARSVSRKT